MEARKSNDRIRLKYFNCAQGGDHEGEVLNYVCVGKNCQKKGLLCSICKVSHHSHPIVPLKLLLSELKRHKQKPLQSSQGFQNELEQLEDEHKMLLYQLRVCVQSLAEKFRQLQSHINQQFSKAKIELLERVQINMKFNEFIDEAINNKITDRQSFIEDINKISGMIDIVEQTNEIKFSSDFIKVVHSFSTFHKQISKKLTDIDEFALSQKNIVVSLDQEVKEKVDTGLQYLANQKFSSSFKSSTITLSNQDTEAKQTKTGAGRFVFLNDGVGLDHQKIRFRVVNLKNWIGVGLGLRAKLKSLQYRFEYNAIGHGSYLISSNGYSWSHSQTENNITVVDFKFKEGEVVEIQYNKTELRFINQATGNSFTLKVSLTQIEQKQACFCANLCSQGDTIKVLQPDQA